jgi:hypothetical protein
MSSASCSTSFVANAVSVCGTKVVTVTYKLFVKRNVLTALNACSKTRPVNKVQRCYLVSQVGEREPCHVPNVTPKKRGEKQGEKKKKNREKKNQEKK